MHAVVTIAVEASTLSLVGYDMQLLLEISCRSLMIPMNGQG
jgi:hypothetical protein